MRTLLTQPYFHLYLHEGFVPVLELQWLSYVGSHDFRAAAAQALSFTRTYYVKAWVGDDRLLGAVRPRDLEWVEENILLPLAQAGLERFALLEAQDALNRRIISGMYTRVKAELPFAIRHFDDLLAARAWASGATTAA